VSLFLKTRGNELDLGGDESGVTESFENALEVYVNTFNK